MFLMRAITKNNIVQQSAIEKSKTKNAQRERKENVEQSVKILHNLKSEKFLLRKNSTPFQNLINIPKLTVFDETLNRGQLPFFNVVLNCI